MSVPGKSGTGNPLLVLLQFCSNIPAGQRMDLDGNGSFDGYAIDSDRNGLLDGFDREGDGIRNFGLSESTCGTLSLDLNNDGEADFLFLRGSNRLIAPDGRISFFRDLNGDGAADALDISGDSTPDRYLPRNNYYIGGNFLGSLQLTGSKTVLISPGNLFDVMGILVLDYIYAGELNSRIGKYTLEGASIAYVTGGNARTDGVTSPDGTQVYLASFATQTVNSLAEDMSAVTPIAGQSSVQGSADGTGTAATLYAPWGITGDGINLYWTEQGNSTVRKHEITSGKVTTIAGSPGLTGTDDGIGSAARFNNPTGITTDGEYLYVSDTGNNTMRRISLADYSVITLTGSPVLNGFQDGYGLNARINLSTALATDGSFVYFVDMYNNAIRRINLKTRYVDTVSTGWSFATGPYGTGWGSGLAAARGALYATDRGAGTLTRIR